MLEMNQILLLRSPTQQVSNIVGGVHPVDLHVEFRLNFGIGSIIRKEEHLWKYIYIRKLCIQTVDTKCLSDFSLHPLHSCRSQHNPSLW